MNTLLALVCIILFSLTAPATRVAAMEAPAEVVILVRILGASVICLFFATRDRWVPPRETWAGIAAVGLGGVIGFSALTAYSMRYVPSGHLAIGLAALPLVTAFYAVLRDGKRVRPAFWIFALVGTLASFSYFFLKGVGALHFADICILLAVFSAAFGFVEGGRLSRVHGGVRIMSWAIMLTLPVTLIGAILYFSVFTPSLSYSPQAWFSMGYLALVSQSLAMFLWFRVLARGPMEQIAMVQLTQPFFTLLASIILLGEHVPWIAWIIALIVVACIWGTNNVERLPRTAVRSSRGVDCVADRA